MKLIATTDSIIRTLPVHDLYIDLTDCTYTFADLWAYRSLGCTAPAGDWWIAAVHAWQRVYDMAFGRYYYDLEFKLAALK